MDNSGFGGSQFAQPSILDHVYLQNIRALDQELQSKTNTLKQSCDAKIIAVQNDPNIGEAEKNLRISYLTSYRDAEINQASVICNYNKNFLTTNYYQQKQQEQMLQLQFFQQQQQQFQQQQPVATQPALAATAEAAAAAEATATTSRATQPLVPQPRRQKTKLAALAQQAETALAELAASQAQADDDSVYKPNFARISGRHDKSTVVDAANSSRFRYTNLDIDTILRTKFKNDSKVTVFSPINITDIETHEQLALQAAANIELNSVKIFLMPFDLDKNCKIAVVMNFLTDGSIEIVYSDLRRDPRTNAPKQIDEQHKQLLIDFAKKLSNGKEPTFDQTPIGNIIDISGNNFGPWVVSNLIVAGTQSANSDIAHRGIGKRLAREYDDGKKPILTLRKSHADILARRFPQEAVAQNYTSYAVAENIAQTSEAAKYYSIKWERSNGIKKTIAAAQSAQFGTSAAASASAITIDDEEPAANLSRFNRIKANNSCTEGLRKDFWYDNHDIYQILQSKFNNNPQSRAFAFDTRPLETDIRIDRAIKNKIEEGKVALLAFTIDDNHWIAVAIKQNSRDGSVFVYYNNPLGADLSDQHKAKLAAFAEKLAGDEYKDFRIIDLNLKLQMDGDLNNCGPYTVATLEHIGNNVDLLSSAAGVEELKRKIAADSGKALKLRSGHAAIFKDQPLALQNLGDAGERRGEERRKRGHGDKSEEVHEVVNLDAPQMSPRAGDAASLANLELARKDFQH